jgi:outer membrane protein OmpA-like peptidoglycan-associated protein
MKKIITMGALLTPFMVQALDMGPAESTVEAGDISTGLYLYYDASEWDTGNNQVDSAIGEVKRQGIFANFTYGLHDDWEVIAKLGFQGLDTEGNEYVKAFDSSGDAFLGLALKGVLYRSNGFSAGPFIQYSRYSGYDIDARVLNDTGSDIFDGEITDLSALEVGVNFQHDFNSVDVFYGVYGYQNKFDLDGDYGSDRLDLTPEEEGNFGLFAGIIAPISDRFNIVAEMDYASKWGASIGVNYLFGHKNPPKPIVITQTQIEYVDRPKPQGPAELSTALFFESNEVAIKEDYWSEIRKFSDFMKKYEDSVGYIEGYCDCTGDDDYNLKLSARRAASVYHIMVDLMGIAPERLSIVPMGEASPAGDNDTEEGRAKNRRVKLVATVAAPASKIEAEN